jgi:hypothetical protein
MAKEDTPDAPFRGHRAELPHRVLPDLDKDDKLEKRGRGWHPRRREDQVDSDVPGPMLASSWSSEGRGAWVCRSGHEAVAAGLLVVQAHLLRFGQSDEAVADRSRGVRKSLATVVGP